MPAANGITRDVNIRRLKIGDNDRQSFTGVVYTIESSNITIHFSIDRGIHFVFCDIPVG